MKYAALLFLCRLLAGAGPDSPEVVFNRAAVALSAGDFVAAEQGFQSVLRKEPDNVAAIANLGILYARTNRNAKAIAEYQRALRLSPNDEPILLNLGLVYLKEEQHSKAAPYFERVLAVNPRNRQARQLLDLCRLYINQVPAALRDLKELNEESPQDDQLLFLLGFAYLKEGDSQTAQSVFNRMLAAAGPVRAEFLLGKASYDAAIFPQAEASFLEVLHKEPHFPDIHLELGKVYISERRTDDAMKELRQALNENSKSEEANYFLGSLLVRENQFGEGVAYLEEAKKLQPDAYGVYLNLGRAELRLGRTAEAVKLLEQAAELNPDDAGTQYSLGRALKSDGRDGAAKGAFDRARALNAHAQSEVSIPGIR